MKASKHCEHRIILVPQGKGLCTCEECGAKVTFHGKEPKRSGAKS